MAYTGSSSVAASANMIDLRSDTVTRPTAGMREAMQEATVGDDVFGDDPTVISLQERVAGIMGKEAALFLPSGTQSNLSALLAHCQRGEEYIAGRAYHVYSNEAGGAAVLGGISPCPIENDPSGRITSEQVESAIKPDDPHCPITRLLCLENTISGRVQDQDQIDALADLAHERGLSVHLDGARLMNAAVAQDEEPAKLVAHCDSVSLCLSKGLGAPLGSILSGSKAFIQRAYRWRKMLGGSMRQAGVVAAAGHFALDHHVARLADDHRNAKKLANGLAGIAGLHCDPATVDTNMVFVTPPAGTHAALRSHLEANGIIVIGDQGAMRLVTHLDISSEDIDRVVDAFIAFMDQATAVNTAAE